MRTLCSCSIRAHTEPVGSYVPARSRGCDPEHDRREAVAAGYGRVRIATRMASGARLMRRTITARSEAARSGEAASISAR